MKKVPKKSWIWYNFKDNSNINVLLTPCFNSNFHFKGIKRDALNNAIDFNVVSWINNAYIYIFNNVH
jgi:hypothetical protein